MWKTPSGFGVQLTWLWMLDYRIKVRLPVDMWINIVDKEYAV